MMSRVKKGMVAGFAATLAVSVLEAVNLLAGRIFEPFPAMVARLIGMEGNLAVGWVAHLIAGTVVLGGLFGVLCPKLPTDTAETKGIVVAVGSFALMMVGLFLTGHADALNGAGGFGVMAWMLVTNAVFGIVLGNVYARLVAREKRLHRQMAGAAPAV